jgi:hypothetical protein
MYDYLWKAQLIWLILKVPMLVKYYKEPLFSAKNNRRSNRNSPQQRNIVSVESRKKKNYVDRLPENPWTLLFFLTFLTITSNIVLYVISPQ